MRHLENCSACQNWLTSLAQVERHLKSANPNPTDSHLRQIHTAVHRHLSHSKPVRFASTSHKRVYPWHAKYAITAAAAIIIIAFGLFSLFSPEPDNPNQIVTMDSVEHVPNQLQYQIPLLASLPDLMMESKIQNMETDIRHALGFFQGCLPQGLIPANQESENKAG
ncbi:MAG: hypothetical protein JXD22_00420 [Sedimentisphaerales bacterium]|nr:hypothetical protein [Sedimentisphaerales bacterium]